MSTGMRSHLFCVFLPMCSVTQLYSVNIDTNMSTLVRRINNVFSPCSLYGVSLWRTCGSHWLCFSTFREADFMQWYQLWLSIACWL